MDMKKVEKEIEVLKRQVKLLEELRALKLRVKELQAPEPAQITSPFQAPNSIPSQWPLSPCVLGHDFPTHWFGTTPPTCRRCGAPSQPITAPYIVTCNTVTEKDHNFIGLKVN